MHLGDNNARIKTYHPALTSTMALASFSKKLGVTSLYMGWLCLANTARECGFFSHKKPQFMTHAKDKLCDFIRYNVQYVMFIVAHIRN
jgi:aspartate/methionine/tyrosine aminotransferase